MRTGKYIGVAALLLAVALMFIPLTPSDDSDGAFPDDIEFEVFWYHPVVEINAGDSQDVNIIVANNESDSIRIYVNGFGYTNMDRVTASSSGMLEIDSGESDVFTIAITSQKYAPTEDGVIRVWFSISMVTAGGIETDYTRSVDINVSISSIYSAGGSYNHILGVWESPFDDALITAAVSFMIWLLIAFIASYLIAPTVLFLFINEKPEERKGIRRAIAKPFVVLIALFGLAQCARIYGLDEGSVATLTNVVNIAYICMGALIVWSIYKAAIRFIFHKKAERATREEKLLTDDKSRIAKREILQDSIVDDSLIPLLDTIGKIFITVIAFASILAALGFDLMIIVTSAGVIGIAISLGAQSTLSQFFSGITLMINRPFVPGDIIRLGTSQEIMRVKKVGLMVTQFDDWNSNSTMTMPNNAVASSLIVNITGKTSVYRVKPIIGVTYGTNVIKALQLLNEAAAEHPRAILDGSYSKPSARLESFEDSYIKLSVAVYVDDFEDYGSITAQIRVLILKKFMDNGIEVPYPKLDVNVKMEE